MNYNSLLDGFFGSNWLRYGLLLVYLILVFVFNKKLFGGKKRRLLSVFMFYGVPLLWLITVGMLNPIFWAYGKAVQVAAITSANGNVYVTDYVLTAGGKMSRGTAYYRIHVIDPKTGEKKLRFAVGAGTGSIIGIHGDTLAYANDESVGFYSVTDGHQYLEWTAETLPKLFPQLASGLDNFSAYKTGNHLVVTSLDGNKWVLNILANTITPYNDRGEQYDDRPANTMYISNGDIDVDNERHSTHTVIGLCDKNGSDRQQQLCGDDDSILNQELVFLDGKIVAFSVKDNYFVVMHYETIARTRVVFTGISLDGKRKLWEVRQSLLRPDDDEEDKTPMSWGIDEQNGLFFMSMENELFAVNAKDGKVLWREIP